MSLEGLSAMSLTCTLVVLPACNTDDFPGAVLIASVEYEDLANLCDRVIVFRHGRPVSELRKPNITEELIVEQCFTTEAGAA